MTKINPETIKNHKIKKIGTNCPTCLRSYNNYPESPVWIPAIVACVLAVLTLVLAHI